MARAPIRSGRARAIGAGFTLFEIVVSLALLAIGVISVLMLFPMGIKAQQMARFQLYAAAKAEEMVEIFTATQNANPAIDTESPEPWNVMVSYRSQDWDLECRLSTHRYGIIPLPTTIARRIDSDDDQIQKILDDGGYVYYAQPGAATATEEQFANAAPNNETQKLLFAVRGYAQQNALTIFPLKNWPYVVPWPSPPMHGFHMNEPRWLPPMSAGGTDFWTIYAWPCNSYRWWGDTEDLCYPWETAHVTDPAAVGDPDVQKVFDWPEGDQRYGYFPYACGRLYQNGDQPATNFGRPPEARRWDNQGDPVFPDAGLSTGTAPTRDACIRYVQAAAWYCMRKVGNDPSWWAPSDTTNAQGLVSGGPEPWKQVQAMRFLSHAATCLTSWYPLDDGTQPEDLKRGVTIPMVTLGGIAGPADFKITHDLVVWYHERAMKTVMEYCAKYPYDWGTPRPAQRTIMTDHPLLQYDLFSPPLQGTIVGTTPAVPAKQWRPISPRPIRNFGLSFTYPAMPTDPTMVRGGSFPPASDLVHSTQDGSLANRWGAGAMFGDIDHYTLTAPFEAFHRCREIVFWAADWQSFEDFETCPSAPVDASKYPLSAPREDAWDYWGQGTHLVHNIWDRMIDMQFRDEQLWAYRNPEKTLLFWPKDGVDPRTLPTGTDMTERMILNNPFIDPFSYPDYGPDETRRRTFNGLYGADRNFNKRLDRGPLPTSARIRATTVARFNFYDPRLVCVTR